MTSMRTIVSFIRVKQWYKNVIIFLPLVFSFKFFLLPEFLLTVLGFIALSMISSAMYARNDIKDLETDKSHPLKKQRALPAGRINVKQAETIFGILLVIGFGISILLNVYFTLLLAIFFANTEIYSRWTKNIIFLDAFAIGINFIIRAMAGIVLLHTPLSPWIILGVFFVALFLAFTKRKGELITLEEKAHEHRVTLKDYSSFSLNSALIISAVMIIVTYSLYAMHGPNGDWRLILTVPFIIFVIFRHLYLSGINDTLAQTNEVFKDKHSLVAIIAYAIFTIILLYMGHSEI
ncbi:MAG: UbiA family prenyltransferase, partial [Thaumarchaeota archaeon]|nr:UbiA family prenyltransferase [Nitrososphaerota archaeon]